ncbi:MAG: methyltransferase domain-containing protein [Alphaproteobacteria bacterium]|nr:methyltransferase domain-containing protein [Alphaproteobacteria bacterium]
MFWGRRKAHKLSEKKQKLFEAYQHQQEDMQACLERTLEYGHVVLDVGCGRGESSLGYLAMRPDAYIIACDLFYDGLAQLCTAMKEAEIKNMTILLRDALDVLQALPDASVDVVLLFFPDPWPKNRHHKRRIMAQDGFMLHVKRVLKKDGVFVWRTDSQEYLEHGMEILQAEGFMSSQPFPIGWQTTYEKKACKLSQKISTVFCSLLR